MTINKKYWKSTEELKSTNEIVENLKQREFVEHLPVERFLEKETTLNHSDTSRRDFLKYLGFSTVTAALTACEGPVKKTIPYIVQPEEIIPGVANYYATSFNDGFDIASVLVKTREGRPIKIENNLLSKEKGITNVRNQAFVLSLYDNQRAKEPKKNGISTDWQEIDYLIKNKISESIASNKKIILLTHTISSPTTRKLVDEFKNLEVVEYDAICESSTLNAFEKLYGLKALPNYTLEKANLIVSFGADFLGDWNGGGFSVGYSKNRIPKNGNMSYHIQLEANLSLSGANADKRIPLTPSEQKLALAKLYSFLNDVPVESDLSENITLELKNIASLIKEQGKNAVILCDCDDENAQLLSLVINEQINSASFDKNNPIYSKKGNKETVNALIKDMNSSNVGLLIINNVNPVYSLPNTEAFTNGLKKTTSIAFSLKEDETASLCNYIAPANHLLESWGDVQFSEKQLGLTQPVIKKLFNTRQLEDCLLLWNENSTKYYDYLKSNWEKTILSNASWDKTLHDGVYYKKSSQSFKVNNINTASVLKKLSDTPKVSDKFELVLYTKTSMGDGFQANNPWLQEFPDPITRVSWDNYLTVSVKDAERIGFTNRHVADGALNGSYAYLEVNGKILKAPVIIQPGQAEGSVGLAFGYGKKKGLKSAMQVGVNAFSLYNEFNKTPKVNISLAKEEHEFACVQLHNTLMGRGDIIKETTLEEFKFNPKEDWNPLIEVSHNHKNIQATSISLWDEFDTSIGHHFNLSIDLNACTGCGACVIACHAENNVPVVGKQEVRKSRDMHWLRIDRYYSSESTFKADTNKKNNISGVSRSMREFSEMENPARNPQIAFQPVMCQHCNHAPCETVCPVAATSHGRQGQNQMAYNRCVGTRYCANNCPYKVRRFNWFLYNNNEEFDFNMNNDLGKMVLNPDVSVRSRGVMEKCSLCIQKTQKTILDAKREKRKITDGEFQTACSQACGTDAMVFGDLNDKTSKVYNLSKDDRAYHLLEHVGTKPNVFYHTKVRNTNTGKI